MGCCTQTEQHDSREEGITALRRTVDEAPREVAELEPNQEDAARPNGR